MCLFVTLGFASRARTLRNRVPSNVSDFIMAVMDQDFGVAMIRRLFLCTLGLHRRDGRKAAYDERHVVRAPCKYCGKPLQKHLNGKWIVSHD